jgi:dTDP-4-amino-4,6-dideoxygalactose transaminase
MSPDPIAFIDLDAQRRRLGDRIDQAIATVLEHGKFIMGPEVAELERRLTGFTGAGHTVGCASGTDALVMALMALDLRPGQAVVVPTFTFASTGEAVALLGGVPVFADIRADTFNLDPDHLPAAVAAARATGLDVAGVIAVDLFGQPAEYDQILAIADAEGAWVIADAAQSLGATVGDRSVGTLAAVTTTSFFPAKPLGCYGDGGAVFAQDPELAAVLRSIRVHGQGSDKYDNVRLGINGRLDTMQAAILLEKLDLFPGELTARQQVADRYHAGLPDDVATPVVLDGMRSAWAQYTVRVAERDGVAESLRLAGVPTAVYYPRPLHQQTAYRGFPVAQGGLPVAEAAASEVLSLPMHPYLDDGTQDRIINAVAAAVGR